MSGLTHATVPPFAPLRRGLPGLVLAAAAVGQVDPALFTLTLPEVGRLGQSVAVLGDLDADGYAEIVAGVPEASSVLVLSGRDGSVLRKLTRASGRLGASVAVVGDVDRDGAVDLASGDPADAGNGANSGAVVVWSGRTWQQLWLLRDGTGEALGSAVSAAGDYDRDGYADVLVGQPGSTSSPKAKGKAQVFSGRTGKKLHTFNGTAEGTRFGSALVALGDVDADGYVDLAVASPRSASVAASGYVRVYSGRRNSLLRELRPVSVPPGYGMVLAALGDLDRDGVGDLGIGVPLAPTAPGGVGMVWVHSGDDGKELLHLQARSSDPPGMGSALAALGDVSGDGWPDFAIGAASGAGAVRVVSGRDGSVLLTRAGTVAGGWLGACLVRCPDLNDDGVEDLVAGAPGAAALVAVSTVPLSFRASPRVGAASGPRRQGLELDAGPARAYSVYILFGSKSGTLPGQRFGSVVIPLNPDAYHLFTLFAVNTILVPQAGLLDGQGRASAALLLPATLPPEFTRTTLHHAFALADWRTGLFTYASNAAPLML